MQRSFLNSSISFPDLTFRTGLKYVAPVELFDLTTVTLAPLLSIFVLDFMDFIMKTCQRFAEVYYH